MSDAPAETSPRRRRSLSRRIAFAVAPLALLLVAVEVWARVDASLAEPSHFLPDPWRDHVFIPRHAYTSTGYWGTMEVHTNALGHRGPELASPKPATGYRAVCMGGSQTFGFGSTRDATSWPGLLAASLQAARPALQVEVLNAGVPAWNVRTALSDWQLGLREHGFDLAIVCEAYNDLQETASARYHSASRATVPDEVVASRSLLSRVLGQSAAFRRLVTKLTEKRIKYSKLPGSTPEGEAAYARNLRALVAALRADRVAVVLCTYPHLYGLTEAEMTAALGEKRVDATLKRSPLTYAGAQLGLARMNDIVRQVAREEGVALCDLERLVPAQAALWVDPIHLSDAGCEVVATAVSDVVLQGPLKQ